MARFEKPRSAGKEEDALLREIEDLRARLEEAEATIEAIRTGGVDALIVSGPEGDKVFALEGADYPYRVMMEIMNEGIVTLGADGGILSCNTRFAHFLKMPSEQILGKPLARFATKDNVPELSAFLKRATEKSCARAATLACADGTALPVNLSAGAFEVGGLPALCIVFTDMTERRRAEQALQDAHDRLEERVAERTQELEAANRALERARAEAESERLRLEAIMEALPTGVAITDAHGGNIRANREFERIWSGPRPAAGSVEDYAAYKACWADTGHPVAPEEWASARAVGEARTVVGQILEIQRFDGSRAFVINSASPVRDAGGDIIGSAVAIQDISALRKAEADIRRHVEELKAMNEDLARFNNVAVGRELRMIELKKQVNALCIQAGQPPPYPLDFDKEA